MRESQFKTAIGAGVGAMAVAVLVMLGFDISVVCAGPAAEVEVLQQRLQELTAYTRYLEQEMAK